MRGYLLHSAKLRERVRKILGKLGRLVDGKLLIPEEVVHYSEWVHVMRGEIAKRQVIDCSHIRATIHPACHVYKMVPEDVIYDDDVLDGNRVAVSTGIMQIARHAGHRLLDLVRLLRLRLPPHHLRARVHALVRDRPQDPRGAVDEAHADVMIGHDTGCITTLDKNQWISKADGKPGRACRCWPTASSPRWSAARIRTRSCSRTGMRRRPRR